MLELVIMCFQWMPAPLAFLVSAVVSIFSIIVAFQVVKLVIDIVKILAEIFGGIFTKIISVFL